MILYTKLLHVCNSIQTNRKPNKFKHKKNTSRSLNGMYVSSPFYFPRRALRAASDFSLRRTPGFT